jgi:hypothetical protein
MPPFTPALALFLVADDGNDPSVSRLSGECFTSKLIGRCLVCPRGFEPRTFRLKVERSNQLS